MLTRCGVDVTCNGPMAWPKFVTRCACFSFLRVVEVMESKLYIDIIGIPSSAMISTSSTEISLSSDAQDGMVVDSFD